MPTARHKASLVAFDNKLYLIGGRRINPMDVCDLLIGQWMDSSQCPTLPTPRAGNMATVTARRD